MSTEKSNKKLLLVCGLIGLFGCISVVITDLIGIVVVDGYNPISQTISDLAIHKKAWIQDIGLNLFAASFVACAVGLFSLNLGGWKWKTGAGILLLLAVDILIISEYDQYADLSSFGSTVHFTCVCILGVLFTIAPALLSFKLHKVSRGWQLFSLWTAICWGVLSPIFFFTPNGWNGAYERFLSVIVIMWVAFISWLLVQKGLNQRLISPFTDAKATNNRSA
ncbi:MAG: DUF998 domain-containing protein [Leptolyngbyaceae cyanobacterium SM1_1_3]|nr:DUF998 domain-containing protein [Leptolyngbyaceae cyanobacterium SM1_1_3]NJM85162.1 DUF998 domain-containing protein [Leptolyngbyaceae cyanobacterium RM2_2_21]NJN02868.1 DUF998 domain-containing protein [Leptolyngbyaceae cyanobacterium RM1_1_2]NJO09108.1 DUF998 domain-containing protein [Leptolyngbyaceae cyanobacterium SL_1_1]